MIAEPLYPFGFGLSYSSFKYSNLSVSKKAITNNQSTEAVVTVTNTGKYDAEEVAELYITHINSSTNTPLFSLKGFKRVKLKPGVSANVKFTITPDMLATVNEAGESKIEKGEVKIFIGGSLPTKRSEELGATKPAETIITIQ